MIRFEVEPSLIKQYKLSIGDFNGNELDSYYKNFLMIAKSDLLTDNIDRKVLDTDLGKALTILYAECLMNKQDIATNPTISLLRNKLAIMTQED